MSQTARVRRRRDLTPLFLLIPAGVVLLALTAWPLIQLVVTSFLEFGRAQIFGAPPVFVGLDNYADVLTDAEFWQVLGRSVAFCLVNVLLTMLLGIAIGVLMTKLGGGFKLLVSVGLLLAWAMPPVTASVVWGWIFDTDRGVVNYLLTQITGADFSGHSWLIDPLSFFFVATIIVTWQAIPFVAFTVFAGLTQVPNEVLEAAEIDGATGWQRFRLIVLPYLRGVLVILLILQIIWDMRVFSQIYALQTVGGIAAETNTIGVYIFKVSIGAGDLGAGGAISVLLVILMLALSGYYIRSLLKQEES
ncbi:carbohydrate ABC transporter permease [Pseudolysinimonas yzui]|uniref:Sugar ABC transporter permease n=1 Tax=Pseudolysinimonas yzui TaxID=2708254 RepID=A0A8J3M1R8_9MICO|nr:sugar ABC transporter permease [Pseudolysinimonas yzui]GHF20028.1 sugar ABC transporter permease [Pseudolysinimonas yzui]